MRKSDTADMLTDDEIVSEFFARDTIAIDHVSKKYGSYIYSVCFNLLHHRRDSEECENVTYLNAWNSIPPNEPKDLKAYLASLARAVSVDRYRREHRKKRRGITESLTDFDGILSDDVSVTDKVEANELSEILNSFLRSLKEKERVCFVKRYYFGCSVAQIVRQMGIPKSTVYNILDTVKEKLKIELKEEGYYYDKR